MTKSEWQLIANATNALFNMCNAAFGHPNLSRNQIKRIKAAYSAIKELDEYVQEIKTKAEPDVVRSGETPGEE
jgi:hypothetical protein